jgi:hypothetical protein
MLLMLVDINLSFTGNLTIDAGSESGSEVSIDNVDNVIISADNTITFNSSALTAGITSVFINSEKVDLNSNDTFTVETSYAGDTNVAGLIVSDKTPARGVYMEYNNSTTPSYQLVSSTRDNVVLSSQYGTNTSELKLESNTTTITADIFNVVANDVSITGTLTVIGATDIDLGFSGNVLINGNDTVDSKVTIENVDDINIAANEEISINAANDISIEADDISITGTLTVTNSDSESVLGVVGTGQGFSHISENATRSANLNCLLDSSGEPSSIMSCNDTSYPAYDDDSVGSQVASSAAGASISFTNYTDTETSAVTVDNFGITLIAPTDKGISFTLATYADNAAAVLGGLAVGKIYKTATGELRIVV